MLKHFQATFILRQMAVLLASLAGAACFALADDMPRTVREPSPLASNATAKPGVEDPALAQGHSVPAFQRLPHLDRSEILPRSIEGFTAYLLKDGAHTVVIDFPDVQSQGRMFGRIVLYVEREGAPRNRVMPFAEIQDWLVQHSERFEMLTVGNNFRAVELARFFNAARTQNESLSEDEHFLLDWLLRAQLLAHKDQELVAVDPKVIVITVPQPSSVKGCAYCTILPAHRYAILEHELAHARFATDAAYQEYVLSFWQQDMSHAMREQFTRFLRKRGYDAANQELLANEMQAFLMHTPHPAMFKAAALGVTEEELAALRLQFRSGLEQHSTPTK